MNLAGDDVPVETFGARHTTNTHKIVKAHLLMNGRLTHIWT